MPSENFLDAYLKEREGADISIRRALEAGYVWTHELVIKAKKKSKKLRPMRKKNAVPTR